MNLIEKIKDNENVINRIKNIAKRITIGSIDYNDNFNGYSYENLSKIMFSEDYHINQLYDTYEDELYQSEKIFNTLKNEFPELLSNISENEKLEVIEFIKDIAINNFNYINFKLEILKQSSSRWFNIEMPYYREVFSLMEDAGLFYNLSIRDQYIKIIDECAKRMGIIDTLDQYLYSRDIDMKHSIFTREQINYALNNIKQGNLGIKDYYKKVLEFMLNDNNTYNTDNISIEVSKKYNLKYLNNDELIKLLLEEFDYKYGFARKSVYNLELFLNLEYSPLCYDEPLSFYTKIKLSDLQLIIDNPGEIYKLSLSDKTYFGITSDGGAAESIDREDIIIPVTYDISCGGNFLTLIDNYKDKGYYDRTCAYLDDFFGDKLCGLSSDDCGELKLIK